MQGIPGGLKNRQNVAFFRVRLKCVQSILSDVREKLEEWAVKVASKAAAVEAMDSGDIMVVD